MALNRIVLSLALLALSSGAVSALEYPIGMPQVQHGFEVAAVSAPSFKLMDFCLIFVPFGH